MRIVFRCDASQEIGIGHVMRCVSLSNALFNLGWDVAFWTCSKTSELVPSFLNLPFEIIDSDTSTVTPKGDVLVVDHYSLDEFFEKTCRPYFRKIIVIDDLANRKHDCDMLLDQTYGRRNEDYSDFVSEDTRLLLGENYIILRPEFLALRDKAILKRRVTAGTVENILVNFGGVDTDDLSYAILKAVKNFKKSSLNIQVVLGALAPNLKSVQSIATEINKRNFHQVVVHEGVQDMERLMVEADIAIGAGGITSWERCSLGLPTLLIETADNQKLVAKNLHNEGALINLGAFNQNTPEEVLKKLEGFIDDPDQVMVMAQVALQVCDGNGISRIIPACLPKKNAKSIDVQIRAIKLEDAEVVFQWQSHPETRKYFRNSEAPEWERHIEWMAKACSDVGSFNLIVECDKIPAGMLRLTKLKDKQYEIHILTAPDFYGKSVATQAVKMAQSLVCGCVLWAEIMPENEASISLFTGNDFILHEDNWYVWSSKS